MAEARVTGAKSNLTAVEQMVSISQAELGRTQTMNGYTKMTAPFGGTITRRFANTGSMIQAGTASQTQAMLVVQLSQNNVLRLLLPVPESVVPKSKVGQKLDVRVPSLTEHLQARWPVQRESPNCNPDYGDRG